MKLTVKVECPNCGEPILIPFDFLYPEYGKCDCGEGVKIYYKAGILNIERLPEEQGGVL